MTVDQSNIEGVEAEQNAQPNLREQLQQNLEAQYEKGLKENGTMPIASIKALVGLLSTDDPTSADVLEALSKMDANQDEGEGHE